MSDARQTDNARLVTQVVVVLGALSIFALFAFIVIPGLAGEGRVVPAQLIGQKAPESGEGWLDPAEAPPAKSKQIPPIDPAEVMTPNPALLARGKALYAQNCVPCHGAGGKGDGPSAATLNPKPRNFADPAGWKNGPRITGIYQTLVEGLKGTGMVAYDYLPPKDRMALVHQVRALGKLEAGAEDPAKLEALAAQFKQAGGRVPAHIPVSLAIARLDAEAIDPEPLAPPAAGDPGAGVFQRAVVDPRRAARVLAANPGWRSDVGALARTVALGAPANGFSPAVAALAPGEWQTLQEVLVRSARGDGDGK